MVRKEPRIIVSILILCVIAISLFPFAYPIVSVPFYITTTIIRTSTITTQSPLLLRLAVVTGTYYYYTSTATGTIANADCWYWDYNGDFRGCFAPYFTASSTLTSKLSTTVTTTSTTTSHSPTTLERMHTNESTYTRYHKIPMYASLGLTDFEFALLAVIITAVAILYGRRKLQLVSDIKFWKQRDDEREKE